MIANAALIVRRKYVRIERRLIGAAGRIVAIEPSPANVSLLERNVRLNACTDVTVLEMAVSDQAGRQAFENVADEDAIDLICRGGGVRSVLLSK
jgi:FkbM family methyltransferase